MMSLPELPNNIGKTGKFSDGEGLALRFTIIDEVVRSQSRYASGDQEPRKVLVLQRVRFDSGPTEVRSGYYVLNHNMRRWVWARFSQLAPEEDLLGMIEEAKSRGWFATSLRPFD